VGEELDPVHAGHAVVGDDDRDRALLELRQRVERIGADDDRPSGALDQAREGSAMIGLVVDDEERRLVTPRDAALG
jgi:hypothetical protein